VLTLEPAIAALQQQTGNDFGRLVAVGAPQGAGGSDRSRREGFAVARQAPATNAITTPSTTGIDRRRGQAASARARDLGDESVAAHFDDQS
jgi:hypothetical protein